MPSKRRNAVFAGLGRGDRAALAWLIIAMFAIALGTLRGVPDQAAPASLDPARAAAALVAAADSRRAAAEIDADFDARRSLTANENSGTDDAQSAGDMLRANFTLCHSGGGRNCVVDGDTFWFEGRKIRIADIDTPETHPARCAAEAARGNAATRRLSALLNAGPFSLTRIDRDTDRYGRQLRVVTRGGESVGGILVDEDLARWYGGGVRDGWC